MCGGDIAGPVGVVLVDGLEVDVVVDSAAVTGATTAAAVDDVSFG